MAEQKKTRANIIKLAVFIFFVSAVFILARLFNLGGRISELKEWIKSLGFLGPVVYTAIYSVAVVFAIPGSLITVLAGGLFGSAIGILVVSLGSTAGAALAFLVSRYFARGAVYGWLGKNEKFRALDEMTKKHGDIIVAITRLVPLFPFNLLNYGFGMTKVRFRTYVMWSWLCMLPGTVLYVVGGDIFAKGIEEGKVPWELITVLISMLVILTLLVRKARKILEEKK